MSEDRRRILEMLKNGKISVAEAEELLDATGGTPQGEPARKAKPKYLRVLVHDNEDNVDIRIPLQLVRSGIKLGAFIPGHARERMTRSLHEKGVDFDLSNLDPKAVEELIDGLADMSIDVGEASGETVRIFCE
ncbi:MAG TPA: hypothetical protein VFI02_11920 [Armatimonadota bacterium]|nr:hypothetical protein [Armatimonadota bacterium]